MTAETRSSASCSVRHFQQISSWTERFLIIQPKILKHVKLLKELITDLEFRMPRHIIMFSMSISDMLHPISICICHFIVSAFDSRPERSLCHAMHKLKLFAIVLPLVVSSLGVIAMSVERYIACSHGFHIHRIFTHERVVYGSIIQ